MLPQLVTPAQREALRERGDLEADGYNAYTHDAIWTESEEGQKALAADAQKRRRSTSRCGESPRHGEKGRTMKGGTDFLERDIRARDESRAQSPRPRAPAGSALRGLIPALRRPGNDPATP
jgi:hypothetical protein